VPGKKKKHRKGSDSKLMSVAAAGNETSSERTASSAVTRQLMTSSSVNSECHESSSSSSDMKVSTSVSAVMSCQTVSDVETPPAAADRRNSADGKSSHSNYLPPRSAVCHILCSHCWDSWRVVN